MGRREEREQLQSTWMVMREPPDRDGSRRERRARVAQFRRSVRAVESSEARRPPAPRDSAAPTEES